MRKILHRFLVVVVIFFTSNSMAYAGTGIWDFYVYIGGQGYYLNNSSGYGGLQAYNGTNFGNVTSSSLFITAAQINTYKTTGSSNVCGGTMYYRVYMQGTTAPAFTALPQALNYDGTYGDVISGASTNQRWKASSPNQDLKSGVTQPGTYNVEIRFDYTGDNSSSSGCGTTFTGTVYTATFTFGNTYYWIGGSTSGWNTSGAWSTSLGGASAGAITPSTSNIYIFDASNLGGGYTGAVVATHGSLGAGFNVAQIILKNNANITYGPSSSSRAITVTGGSGTDFDIPSGSTWTMSNSYSNTSVTMATSATAVIAGTVHLGAAVRTNTTGASSSFLAGTDKRSVAFNSGGICEINISGSSGVFPFGSGTDSSVVFYSGSKMVHERSDYIFGGITKNVVYFDHGSTYEFTASNSNASYNAFRIQNSGGTPSTRTFGIVLWNPYDNGSALNAGAFGSDIILDSMVVSSSTTVSAINIQDGTHTLTIYGNLSNYSTTTLLNFSPSVNGTFTINFSGTSGTQYILNRNPAASGAGIVFGTTSSTRIVNINVGSSSTVRMGNGVDAGDFQLSSPSSTPGNTVFTVNGTLNMGTSISYANTSSTGRGGTFITTSGSTLQMGHLSGINLFASGNIGNVQNSTRTFNTAGNYEYNATTGNQVTGDALPATVNNLTINNTTSTNNTVQITNSAGTQVNGALYMTAGTMDLNGKTITMGNTTANTIYVTGARAINNTNATNGRVDVPSTSSALTITSASGTSLTFGTNAELQTAKSVNFGSTFTTTNDTFRIKNGGYVPTGGYAPYYGTGSTLIYDCGCNFTSINSTTKEWYENTTGNNYGVPYNVMIKAGSSLNFSSTNFVHELRGDLTIGETTGSSSTLYLSTGSGDLNIGGNWIRNQQGIFTHNNNRVYFNGATGNQTIQVTGGGTETFSGITITKSGGGNVQLITTPNLTNIASAKNSGDVIQIFYGGLDLNGDTLTLSGTGGNINVANGIRTITGAANSTVVVSGSSGTISKTVTSSSSGTLVIDANVKVKVATGIDFGYSSGAITTINGSLEMGPNAYVNSSTNSAPYYGVGSTLIYNTLSNFISINTNTKEWYENSFGSVAGVPYHVTIKSGSSLNFSNTSFDHELRGNLTIGEATGSSSTLTLSTTSGGDLNVGGNWTRNALGVFIHNNREVEFNGSNDATITVSATDPVEEFAYMLLNKSAKANKLTLASSVRVSDRARFNKGTLDLGTKFFTILSTAAKTGRIGQSDSANTNFLYGSDNNTGQFIIQRYFPAKRAWRLVAAPLKNGGGTHTISQAWQEGMAFDYQTGSTFAGDTVAATYATQITGGSISNGFDLSFENKASILKFVSSGSSTFNNSTGTWTPPGNTNSTSVNSEQGWMLFVRGDRKNYGQITTASKTPLLTTLRPRGQINIGDVRVPASGNLTGIQVVGNPYASAVDFNAVAKSGSVNTTQYWVWDPQVGGINGRGAFVALAWNSGTSTYDRSIPLTTGTSTYDNRNIPSGAAVMVDFGTTGGYITFSESNKSSQDTTKAFRPSSGIRTTLNSVEPDGTTFVTDGVLTLFNPTYDTAVNKEDVMKLVNVEGENFSIKKNGALLSIEKTRLPKNTDTIFLNWSKVKVRNYQLEITLDSLENSWTKFYLEDAYKKTLTPLSYSDTTKYDFKIIREDSGSFKADRLRLILKYDPPVYSTTKAWQQQNNVRLQWGLNEEKYVVRFVIERSIDGINFLPIGKIEAEDIRGKGIHQWLDTKPLFGNNFYRIRGIGENGHIIYSPIVRVLVARPSIAVYPNPVTNGLVGLQFTNMPEGNYQIVLMNSVGQPIVRRQFNHVGGNRTEQITLGTVRARGNYQIEILSPDGSSSVIKLVY
ncbi:beta strand repeat-containing protein [Ferruginibacter sp. SUN002]|uniref:beta strand repeat-containing protein n=1 Tax=Ferruginibacter sp. SUN002 TaxID=2937789 RepID=UPI003D363C98